jgi:hypothetical protein
MIPPHLYIDMLRNSMGRSVAFSVIDHGVVR